MQIMLIAGPIFAYVVTKRTCLSLQRKDREIVLHGRETGRIVRLPHGEYIEVHEPLDKYEMYKLVDFKDYRPTIVRPNEKGKITVGTRIRSALSRIYFEDRISPVTQTELDKAQEHSHSPAIEQDKSQQQLTK
jgi:ubiquinol-cytochrome c reductase cytochrome b subunit